ncbi:MAG: hypothetical protein A2031_06985 [Deltaproteobacteria bacterium RBG_19FT_COMBO_43_11]|nr:MAG: hypothetical protein A2031_06985 [Deltaproteobacteria bacterium RBG_19FT_COMBO_43_11]
MFKEVRKLAQTKIVGVVLYWAIRLYAVTFRMKIENESAWLDYLEQGGKALICFWHQHLFIAVWLLSRYKKYQPSVMISKSLDGDIATRIVETAGGFSVRGSSSRGGRAALKEIISRIKQYRLAGHIMDGPQGPAGIVKDGAISMAHGADAAIVPLCVKADLAWYLHSWDRFMIPKPFTRVTVYFYPKIILPSLKAEEDFEKQRKSLEKMMQPYLYL